jgi:ATP-dependent Lhr-like helicase
MMVYGAEDTHRAMHEPTFDGQDPMRQAYDEAFDVQMELPRLREALMRIHAQHKVLKDPGEFTPFAFPIIVDRLREKLTSEELEDRIKKMTERLERD